MDIIKMINRASEKTHHGLIQMKRLSEEIDKKTKFKKQKKRTTIGGSVKLDGLVNYKPEQVVTRVKQKIDEKQVRRCLLKVILNKFDSNNCFQIADLAHVIDPSFGSKDKTRKSPRQHSPQPASPATQKESPVSQKESPLKTRRTNAACSFEQKEEVTKYKV